MITRVETQNEKGVREYKKSGNLHKDCLQIFEETSAENELYSADLDLQGADGFVWGFITIWDKRTERGDGSMVRISCFRFNGDEYHNALALWDQVKRIYNLK